MDDSRCREFFTDAQSSPYHRQYEALRAVFVERRSQMDVAGQFGYSVGSLRQLVHSFRQSCSDDNSPPFFNWLAASDRLTESQDR
jgi:hypothetical protein